MKNEIKEDKNGQSNFSVVPLFHKKLPVPFFPNVWEVKSAY